VACLPRACGSAAQPALSPCLSSLLPAGLKDAEECIRLAPDFAKGYSRKGHLQFFMKVGWESGIELVDCMG
jgi:hypothetical protein